MLKPTQKLQHLKMNYKNLKILYQIKVRVLTPDNFSKLILSVNNSYFSKNKNKFINLFSLISYITSLFLNKLVAS